MLSSLSGPSHPPAGGGKAAAAGDPAARARGRRQRSDRAGAVLGADRCPTPSSSRRTRRFPATWRPTGISGSACRTARPATCSPGCGRRRRSSTRSSTTSWPSAGSTRASAALVGFSQGTMMSLFVGLAAREAVCRHRRVFRPADRPRTAEDRNPLAAAGAAGPRHRRPDRAVRLAGQCRGGAERGRGAGRDAVLPRHGPFDRPGRAAARRASSCGRGSAAGGSRGLSAARILSASQSAAPSTLPDHLAVRVDEDAGRQPAQLEGRAAPCFSGRDRSATCRDRAFRQTA